MSGRLWSFVLQGLDSNSPRSSPVGDSDGADAAVSACASDDTVIGRSPPPPALPLALLSPVPSEGGLVDRAGLTDGEADDDGFVLVQSRKARNQARRNSQSQERRRGSGSGSRRGSEAAQSGFKKSAAEARKGGKVGKGGKGGKILGSVHGKTSSGQPRRDGKGPMSTSTPRSSMTPTIANRQSVSHEGAADSGKRTAEPAWQVLPVEQKPSQKLSCTQSAQTVEQPSSPANTQRGQRDGSSSKATRITQHRLTKSFSAATPATTSTSHHSQSPTSRRRRSFVTERHRESTKTGVVVVGGSIDSAAGSESGYSLPASAKASRAASSKARFWRFLIDNLNRAVNEIYETCELDESSIQCDEVMIILNQAQQDFVHLKRRFIVQHTFDLAPPGIKPAMAWDVRKIGNPPTPRILRARTAPSHTSSIPRNDSFDDQQVQDVSSAANVLTLDDLASSASSLDRDEFVMDHDPSSIPGQLRRMSRVDDGEVEEAYFRRDSLNASLNSSLARSFSEMLDGREELELSVSKRTPGSGAILHQRLSSPSRKRPVEMQQLEERHHRADEKRRQQQQDRLNRLKQHRKKIEQVKYQREEQTVSLQQELQTKLDKAESNRREHLDKVREKSRLEDVKTREIAFIQKLEEEGRRLTVLEREQLQQARIQQIEIERQLKLQQRQTHKAEVQRRRAQMETERRDATKQRLKQKEKKRQQVLDSIEQDRLARSRSRPTSKGSIDGQTPPASPSKYSRRLTSPASSASFDAHTPAKPRANPGISQIRSRGHGILDGTCNNGTVTPHCHVETESDSRNSKRTSKINGKHKGDTGGALTQAEYASTSPPHSRSKVKTSARKSSTKPKESKQKDKKICESPGKEAQVKPSTANPASSLPVTSPHKDQQSQTAPKSPKAHQSSPILGHSGDVVSASEHASPRSQHNPDQAKAKISPKAKARRKEKEKEKGKGKRKSRQSQSQSQLLEPAPTAQGASLRLVKQPLLPSAKLQPYLDLAATTRKRFKRRKGKMTERRSALESSFAQGDGTADDSHSNAALTAISSALAAGHFALLHQPLDQLEALLTPSTRQPTPITLSLHQVVQYFIHLSHLLQARLSSPNAVTIPMVLQSLRLLRLVLAQSPGTSSTTSQETKSGFVGAPLSAKGEIEQQLTACHQSWHVLLIVSGTACLVLDTLQTECQASFQSEADAVDRHSMLVLAANLLTECFEASAPILLPPPSTAARSAAADADHPPHKSSSLVTSFSDRLVDMYTYDLCMQSIHDLAVLVHLSGCVPFAAALCDIAVHRDVVDHEALAPLAAIIELLSQVMLVLESKNAILGNKDALSEMATALSRMRFCNVFTLLARTLPAFPTMSPKQKTKQPAHISTRDAMFLNLGLHSLAGVQTIASVNIQLAQAIVEQEPSRSSFLHVVRHVIGVYGSDVHNRACVIRAIDAVPWFCFNNPANQSMMVGVGNCLLVEICNLPFQFFTSPELQAHVFPALCAACFKHSQATQTVKTEISLSSLVEFIDHSSEAFPVFMRRSLVEVRSFFVGMQ
eukprot:m.307540 g.307540  ORF g.307540 m.307540 type:complete len:1534 (-) comp15935_c0_seq1:3300-7901(-)